jgi:hypothetical protein
VRLPLVGERDGTALEVVRDGWLDERRAVDLGARADGSTFVVLGGREAYPIGTQTACAATLSSGPFGQR